jgi:hypothetical protein
MTDSVTMKHENVCELERMVLTGDRARNFANGVVVKSPSNRLELDAVGRFPGFRTFRRTGLLFLSPRAKAAK